jgi:hypothetical protein
LKRRSVDFHGAVIMSAKVLKELEERVSALEQQVAELAERRSDSRLTDWRRSAGMFTGDELMKEIFEEGRKIREAERRQAHRGEAPDG